ncbi:MAG: hypothetical protein SGILL_005094 [Bacillariaceae sp.]
MTCSSAAFLEWCHSLDIYNREDLLEACQDEEIALEAEQNGLTHVTDFVSSLQNAIENGNIAQESAAKSNIGWRGASTLKPLDLVPTVPSGKQDQPLSVQTAKHDNHCPTTAVMVKPSRLSRYLYPETTVIAPGNGTQSAENPIFEWMQDERSIESARQVLKLEVKISKLKRDAVARRKAKQECEETISKIVADQAKLDPDLKLALKRLEIRKKNAVAKYVRLMQGAKGEKKHTREEFEEEIAELKKRRAKNTITPNDFKDKVAKANENIGTIDEHEYRMANTKSLEEKEKQQTEEKRKKYLDDMEKAKQRLNSEEVKLRAKSKAIDTSRDAIRKFKGDDQDEDPRFDISESRNVHGLTFLMLAAQNNDVETAKLCFELGANPNPTCPSGLTALGYARFFQHAEMATLIVEKGGGEATRDPWGYLESTVVDKNPLHRMDWEKQLAISQQAAIPADTIASTFALPPTASARNETDDSGVDQSCFDACLSDPASTAFRRVVLLNHTVYHWFTEADSSQRSQLINLLERLNRMEPVYYHRRFIIGVKREKRFEVLCACLSNNGTVSPHSLVVWYTPFVEAFVDGVSNTGILVWSVCQEQQASKYRALIEASDFRRHKVDYQDDRFPAHREFCLELGKDMHLLDLMATSIFSAQAMEMIWLDLDDGHLSRLNDGAFKPRKRLLAHEETLRNAIFSASKREWQDQAGLLTSSRAYISTTIHAGAGTGKTVLLIHKLTDEDVSKKILVLSRLPRLVSFVKGKVEAERNTANATFTTYDDLLTSLVRMVQPSNPNAKRNFSTFTQVSFSETTGTGDSSSINFEQAFVNKFLQSGEQSRMKKSSLKAGTLWEAFRVIKSSGQCSNSKQPLTLNEYRALPPSYGLTKQQREIVYSLFERYQEWLLTGAYWDEADRLLYLFQWGHRVFTESFVSWVERVSNYGEMDLIGKNDIPVDPFYDNVYVDEAQDFTELDICLFIRMSGINCVFLAGDPAQSVEVGIRQRKGTVHGVFHQAIPEHQKHLQVRQCLLLLLLSFSRMTSLGSHAHISIVQVKDVLQELTLQTNHRTHAKNLELSKAVRKTMARCFGVPDSQENALMEGPIPAALQLARLKDLADEKVFRGANAVFLAPDEIVDDIRHKFLSLGIKNDCFGVREAKGLEFPSVALIGFFSCFENVGSRRIWENAMRWLFSSKSVATTTSAERIQGKPLEDCNYRLPHPEMEDQLMMLYTALTRAREHLYIIEVEELSNAKGKNSLGEFVMRQFKNLRLLKSVTAVDEGESDMSAQEHKMRGVMLVMQAINMYRSRASTESVRKKFLDAAERFQADKGNDRPLLEQCNKHLEAYTMKQSLKETVRKEFFRGDGYNVNGKFAAVVRFERSCADFFRLCANDSFLEDEVHEVRLLMEDVFYGTPYASHFEEVWGKLKELAN